MAAIEGRRRRKRRPTDVARWWSGVLIRLRAIGRRRTLTIVAFGLLGALGSASVGAIRGVPLPAVHDEFSYLLAADTFSRGRLTNPPHPHWEHFETIHVIQQPTYASKYPPGQGLVLAAGDILVGHPVAGVWLTAGLLAGATSWMLLSWLPPAWAIIASTFCVIQLCGLTYWSQSYWGGGVATVGGALAFGAAHAIRVGGTVRHGVLFGSGFGIMAVSRPLEGALTALVLGAFIVAAFVSGDRWIRRTVRNSLTVSAAIVMMVALWMGYYNYRVTGAVLSMPYQVHQAQYSASPSFIFQRSTVGPTYRHPELERFWTEYGAERHKEQRRWSSQLTAAPVKFMRIVLTVLGPGAFALLGIHGVLGARYRSGMVALVLVTMVALLTKGAHPHYIAPVVPMYYCALGGSLYYLHRAAVRRRGTDVSLLAVLALLVYLPAGVSFVRQEPSAFAQDRAALVERLRSMPQNSLVLVEYEEGHNYHEEWVYNEAEIDASAVVWARSMGRERDRVLREYFEERLVWRLRVGESWVVERLPSVR